MSRVRLPSSKFTVDFVLSYKQQNDKTTTENNVLMRSFEFNIEAGCNQKELDQNLLQKYILKCFSKDPFFPLVPAKSLCCFGSK